MDFKTFIFTYWREIAYCGAFIVSVLISILRRNVWNSTDEIKKSILEILPYLIVKVEEPGNGENKKASVLKLVQVYVKKHFGIELPASLVDFVNESIENILLTPTKKGDSTYER